MAARTPERTGRRTVRAYGGAVRYRERLNVPASWWVLGVLLALSAALAVGFYTGLGWALAVGAAAALAVAALFWAGSALVVLSDTELRVGRAAIELDYLGGCRALDRAQTADRSGPGADARAYLVLRPYIRTAVELTLDDAADPVPYWLVSTRRPHQLERAVAEALSTRLPG